MQFVNIIFVALIEKVCTKSYHPHITPQDNAVSVQSVNGYSARSDITDRHFDNRDMVARCL